MLEPYLAYLDEGIVVVHPITGEIEMNPNMALWLGRRETSVKDILWPDFINHLFPVGDYKVLSSLKAQLPVFKSELVLYGKNQTAFPVQVTLLPDSHVTGHSQTCMIVKDVSSERKLNALKSDYLDLVSHELRTPLTAAKSTADTLRVLRQNAVQEQEIELLNILQRTLSGMSTLLNNLLDLSKLEAGKMTMKRSAIQVDRLARDILAYFRPEANLKQVFLGTDFGEPLPLVYADPIRIEQVLSNLISNALKHTPEHGQVEVGVHPLAEGGGVRISVKDTGKGIAPENLPRLFDRFYQVSQRGGAGGRSGAGELGTGLGLSLSQQIVRLHGSAIEVESKLGQGSHFYFSLRPFSYRLHLNESFKEAVNNLSKEDPDLTLAVVKVNAGKNGAGEAELEKTLQKILRRPSDFASRLEAQECLVVFAYAAEPGMRKILSRVREVFKKNFSAEIRSAAARFPADGGRCEDLLDRCLKKLRLKPLQKTGG